MRIPKQPFALLILSTGALVVATMWEPGSATAALDAELKTRCARRLSISILGRDPDATLLAAANPQDSVEALLDDSAFPTRFASFVNATFNEDRGAVRQDAAYYLTRHVLTNNLPWKELFVGAYRVDFGTDPSEDTDDGISVVADDQGLGFFRSKGWLERYAGNEGAGYKLSTAYRIVNNTLGVKLTAVTNAAGVDISATGRKADGCRGCHYDGPFALDLVARVLTRKKQSGNTISFTPPTDGPQTVLNGKTISDDKGLVSELVSSDDFKFRACRLAFSYLYGRPDTACEGPLFDRCIDAFTQDGTMRSALATIAKDTSYCE